jgi:hypothetical protein
LSNEKENGLTQDDVNGLIHKQENGLTQKEKNELTQNESLNNGSTLELADNNEQLFNGNISNGISNSDLETSLVLIQ